LPKEAPMIIRGPCETAKTLKNFDGTITRPAYRHGPVLAKGNTMAIASAGTH